MSRCVMFSVVVFDEIDGIVARFVRGNSFTDFHRLNKVISILMVYNTVNWDEMR